MLMTECAMMDPGPGGNSILSRCCRAIAHFFGFGQAPSRSSTGYDRDLDIAALWTEVAQPAQLRIVPKSEPVIPHKWRRHEQLLDRPASILSEPERQARHQAVRGLYAARAGAHEAAEDHFAQAAICTEVDLCAIPGFWSLNRSAMMTAVRAYETTGRLREASALEARIRSRFRPRVLSPIPDNVTELPARRSITLTSNT